MSTNKLTQVKIIQRKNDLALVEWNGKYGIPTRSWVANTELSNDTGRSAEVEKPERGIPYGVEFWRIAELKATPVDLDRELKARGIWTVADVRTRPNEVISALKAAYGVDLTSLLLRLEMYESELKTEA